MDINSNASSQLWKKYSDGTMAPLFATADEILNHAHLSDAEEFERNSDVMKRKLEEADTPLHEVRQRYKNFTQLSANKDAGFTSKHVDAMVNEQPGWNGGLTDMIREKGYDWSQPISITSHNAEGDIEVENGHHRLAVMQRDRPNEFIPIRDSTEYPSPSYQDGDAAAFTHVAKTRGHEYAKLVYPLKQYPWLKHLHENP
jgi:hypothetical protein